jgi:hypothetical protein
MGETRLPQSRRSPETAPGRLLDSLRVVLPPKRRRDGNRPDGRWPQRSQESCARGDPAKLKVVRSLTTGCHLPAASQGLEAARLRRSELPSVSCHRTRFPRRYKRRRRSHQSRSSPPRRKPSSHSRFQLLAPICASGCCLELQVHKADVGSGLFLADLGRAFSRLVSAFRAPKRPLPCATSALILTRETEAP